MGTGKIILAVMMLIAGLASEALADGQFISGDYVLSGVDGKLIQAGPDKWMFEIEPEAGEGGVGTKGGLLMELLPSSTLEKMIEDAKERPEARYRLWGKATKFEGKNYVFAMYFVGLHKLDKPAGQPQKEGVTGEPTAINAPNDVLNIPDEIVSRLKTSEVLPSVDAPAEVQSKQDAIFANRAGRVSLKEGKYVFEPDGLGRGVERFSIELLPCQSLDDAMGQVRSESNPVRFSVAGILTKYKDKQYLLLQKATRVYSYGNFGR
ncbi:MAG: hypothetical protein ABSG82_08020 [Sedimentisphaerales bacterium]|jgi:hypothetical protein